MIWLKSKINIQENKQSKIVIDTEESNLVRIREIKFINLSLFFYIFLPIAAGVIRYYEIMSRIYIELLVSLIGILYFYYD